VPEYKARRAVINIHTVDGQNFGVHVSPRLDYWGLSDQEYIVEAREIANTLIQSRYPIHCSGGFILERTSIHSYVITDGEEVVLQGKGPNKVVTLGLYIAGTVLLGGLFLTAITLLA
jgi:hypothetical protein